MTSSNKKKNKRSFSKKKAQYELTKEKMYQIFVYSDRFLHRGEPMRTFTLLTETNLVKLVRRNLGRGPFKHQCRHIQGGTWERAQVRWRFDRSTCFEPKTLINSFDHSTCLEPKTLINSVIKLWTHRWISLVQIIGPEGLINYTWPILSWLCA